ncbi:MAG TPA: transketolase [Stellaceae bacterium]
MANAIRALAMDAVEKANSGHPGLPMGMADVATVLWSKFLKFDAADPAWPDRDRFVLSAGHGSMLLYALTCLTGYPGVTIDDLKQFRQVGSTTPGHPEHRVEHGIETTTGPLSQGLGNSVGMAIAERVLAARFGADMVAHYTYVIASDGDLMEGHSHESVALAGHLRLGKLIVFWDHNSITIDGSTELSTSDAQLERFAAAGWDVAAVDGHDAVAVEAAITHAQKSPLPSFIACRTIIGFGAPTKAGTAAAHGTPLGATEIAGAKQRLDWPYPAFVIPDDVAAWWLAVGKRGISAHAAWHERMATKTPQERTVFEHRYGGVLKSGWREKLNEVKAKFAVDKPKIATRQASGDALGALVPAIPTLVGGSADLTPSNNTYVKGQKVITPDDFSGSYIHYGIREHAMVSAMSGMALHGGIVPYGGTFLIFSDYARPAIRLAALMKQRIVYVFTHDSIGLGEDGPTHQPVEILAGLRAIPQLQVFRPADAMETAECWELALTKEDGPSVLALSRQGLPALRDQVGENLSARGAYVLAEAEGARQVTLLATGSEVSLAMDARKLLAARGVKAAVVSMPCWELFDAQDHAYRDQVLGTAPRVGVEAAVRFGWDRYIGADGAFIGMTGFGGSGPGPELFKHFGITSAAVADAAVAQLSGGKKQ